MIDSLLVTLIDLPGWMLVSLGFYISYRILRFPDLTVDASFITAACGTAIAAKEFNSSVIGLVFAIVLSGIAGLLTSLVFISNPRSAYKLLSGVLVLFISYSVNYRLLGQQTDMSFYTSNTFMNMLSKFQIRHNLYPLMPLTCGLGLLLVVTAFCMYYWFLKTKPGLVFRTVGPKPQMLRGNPGTKWSYIIIGLVITNSTVGVGGWYQASVDSFANLNLWGTILHALAATILGEIIFERATFLKDRKNSVISILLSPLLGVVIYYLIKTLIEAFFISEFSQVFETVSVNQQDQNTVMAILILIIVVIVRAISLRSGSQLEDQFEED